MKRYIKCDEKEVGKIETMDIDHPEKFEICDAIYEEILKK